VRRDETRPAGLDGGSFEERYWREDSDYRKFADYLDGLHKTRRWYTGFIRLIRGELPAGGRHVDAGCGHGAIIDLLRERGFDSHGFDTSAWIVDQAHEAGAGDRIRVGNIEGEIPFEGSFRLITCLEVLEHLPQPQRALDVLAERLESGGRLVATTPNLRPRIPWRDPVQADPTHISVHAPDWWAEQVRRAGLEIVRLATFVTLPMLWRVTPLLSIWMPLGATAGPGILLIAERP
jgi:2-polyprenyl-3-methyl-5-hydroxy-6-metoxy-1,4-benzoquinol methylase